MIKLFANVALAAVVAAPAFAQTAPPPYWYPYAAPRQSEPAAPGTATVPGPTFPSRAQKALDTANK
jgi:hypothetical protein